MDKFETTSILAVLKAAYPKFYQGPSLEEANSIVNLWAEMFADDPAEIVATAVKAMIASRNSNFPPNIGEVKEQIRKLTTPDSMTEQEAWSKIYKAIVNTGYDSKAEFDKLPKSLQRLVGSPQQLFEWSMMDVTTVQSVVASNVMRSFRAIQAQEQEQAKLPQSVKRFLQDAKLKSIDDAIAGTSPMLTEVVES
jgi:uncharacterized protein (UPF0335 family)